MRKIQLIGIIFLVIALWACRSMSTLDKNVVVVDHREGGFLEERYGDQTTDLFVYDIDKFESGILESGELRRYGVDMFLYLCSSCHGGNNVTDKTGLYFYEKSLSRFIIVDNKEHGQWKLKVRAKVDAFDIKAISLYLEPKMNMLDQE